METPFSLNFGTEDEPRLVKIETRTPSMALSDEVFAAREKFVQALRPFLEEEKRLEKAVAKNDADALLKASEFKRGIARLQFEHDVQTIQIIAQRKQLTTEDKARFDAPPSDAFWQNQDISEIRECANSFRAIIGA